MRGRVIALMLVAALSMSVAQYSAATQWFSDYFLRRQLMDYTISGEARSSTEKQAELIEANAYNTQLANHQVQLSDEATDLAYQHLLAGEHNATMATVSIPKLDLILPVMHGTTDDVLALGAGHYYGSSLPVGGPGTHTAITAHSGLVTRAFFTHLPDLTLDDEFTIHSVAGDLYYKVIEMQQVKADAAADMITFAPGRDLATLITCVPIGINTHRLLVTGERVAGPLNPDQVLSFWHFPGFPWWAVWILSAILGAWLIGKYVLVPYWERQDAKASVEALETTRSAALVIALLTQFLLPHAPIIDPTATYNLIIHKHATTNVVGNGKVATADPPSSPALKGAHYSVERINGYDFDGDGRISAPAEQFDLTGDVGWHNAAALTAGAATSGVGLIDKALVAQEVTNEHGVAAIPLLPAGLYLVTETAAPRGYSPSAPFLVTLPMTDPDARDTWLSTVHVYPKNHAIPPVTPPPTSAPPVTPPPTGSTHRPTRPPTGGILRPPAAIGTPTYHGRDRQDVPNIHGVPVPDRRRPLFKTGIELGAFLAAIAALILGVRLARRNRDQEA